MHIDNATRPEERNPFYKPDEINDRWPSREPEKGAQDMTALAENLEYLAKRLNELVGAPLSEIAESIDELFGESVGKTQRQILKDRYDRRTNATPVYARPRTGQIVVPPVITEIEKTVEVPRHNFHSAIMNEMSEDDDE